METLDARELVARFQAGDRADAFTEIYSRYQPSVLSYLVSRVADLPLAEDLTQDVFVRALRNLDRWQWQDKDLRAWLFTIARNLVIDHRRNLARKPLTTVASYVESAVEPPAPDKTDADVINLIRNDALLAAIWRLTPDQRECIVLRYVQGKRIAEVARLMDRETGAIKALTSRATRQLGRLLEGQGWR